MVLAAGRRVAVLAWALFLEALLAVKWVGCWARRALGLVVPLVLELVPTLELAARTCRLPRSKNA
jgi:hypothetical protein